VPDTHSGVPSCSLNNLNRALTTANADPITGKRPHINLVGITYTITVGWIQVAFCVRIGMHPRWRSGPASS